MLSGDGQSYGAELLNEGRRIEPGRKAREHLAVYIQSSQPDQWVTCINQIGWHGRELFILPKVLIEN